MSLIWLGNMEVDFRTYGDGGLNKPTHERDLLTLQPEELVAVSYQQQAHEKCSVEKPVLMTLTRCVNQFFAALV
jgi:hypothetical protein